MSKHYQICKSCSKKKSLPRFNDGESICKRCNGIPKDKPMTLPKDKPILLPSVLSRDDDVLEQLSIIVNQRMEIISKNIDELVTRKVGEILDRRVDELDKHIQKVVEEKVVSVIGYVLSDKIMPLISTQVSDALDKFFREKAEKVSHEDVIDIAKSISSTNDKVRNIDNRIKTMDGLLTGLMQMVGKIHERFELDNALQSDDEA